MRRSTMALGLPLLVVAVVAVGCTTTGTATGATLSGADPVGFNWKRSDSVSGTMSATARDDKTCNGRFFQVTRDTTADTLGPLSDG